MEKQGPKKLKSIQMAIPNKKNSTHSQDGLEAWKPFANPQMPISQQSAIELDFEIVKIIKKNKGW